LLNQDLLNPWPTIFYLRHRASPVPQETARTVDGGLNCRIGGYPEKTRSVFGCPVAAAC
jgi:hypothetical protein